MKPEIRLVHKIYVIRYNVLLVTGLKFESASQKANQSGKHDKLKIHYRVFLFTCPFKK